APAAASDAATRDASVPPTTTSTTTTSPSGDGGVKTVNLDESGDGKTVEVGKGAAIVLMLAASPTSGFDWAVTKAPAALGAPTMGFVAGGDQMGASGKRRIVWTLKDALPAGEHAVELGYARSFEKGVAPFKTFRFKVRAAK
ncbi:MAG TPA: protease inhibitor I42 family protein, partial [Labilithrix sp.]|nr:protease inhibitor I42 family protein [Labilithrix sp.]